MVLYAQTTGERFQWHEQYGFLCLGKKKNKKKQVTTVQGKGNSYSGANTVNDLMSRAIESLR
jgi:hypothetical protein